MDIAISFDQNYFNQFATLLSSIFQYNPNIEFKIHLIVTGLNDQQKNKIKVEIFKQKSEVYFYSIDEELVSKFTTGKSWTAAAYYRLFFPLLVPETVNRLIYIDADTLVLNTLEFLYKTPLNDYPLAAVYDNYVINQPMIGITESGQYFNSGLMLIDIVEWKRQKISEQCFNYLLTYPERIKFVDQCALNAVLKDNWLKLPYTYNCLTSYIPRDLNPSQKNGFLKDIVILHFTLERPWVYLNKHPFRKLYYQYLKQYSVSKYKFISDFEISKMPQRLKLNFIEWYLGNAMMRVCWNKIKTLFKISA